MLIHQQLSSVILSLNWWPAELLPLMNLNVQHVKPMLLDAGLAD